MSRVPSLSSPFLLGFDEIERALDRDTFLEADEAQAFGLVDKVIESRPASDQTGLAEGSGASPDA